MRIFTPNFLSKTQLIYFTELIARRSGTPQKTLRQLLLRTFTEHLFCLFLKNREHAKNNWINH